MKMGEKDVKGEGKSVGVATFEIFDSVDESRDTLGEAVVLGLINAQHRTNACNAVRQAATGRPSKTQLLTMAFDELLRSGEAGKYAGDLPALNARLAQLAAEIAAKMGLEKEEEAPAATEG